MSPVQKFAQLVEAGYRERQPRAYLNELRDDRCQNYGWQLGVTGAGCCPRCGYDRRHPQYRSCSWCGCVHGS